MARHTKRDGVREHRVLEVDPLRRYVPLSLSTCTLSGSDHSHIPSRRKAPQTPLLRRVRSRSAGMVPGGRQRVLASVQQGGLPVVMHPGISHVSAAGRCRWDRIVWDVTSCDVGGWRVARLWRASAAEDQGISMGYHARRYACECSCSQRARESSRAPGGDACLYLDISPKAKSNCPITAVALGTELQVVYIIYIAW